jgi:hypothetical protein
LDVFLKVGEAFNLREGQMIGGRGKFCNFND